jgi:rRNA small subunit pseudouridine methyltransferase Nep1
MLVQLLHKLHIRSKDGSKKLLSVIKNPILDHLPTGCRKIGLSGDSETVKISEFISNRLPTDEPVVFFVGAMPHGDDNFEYAEEKISISDYSLSAAVACSKLCHSYEDLWNVA